MPDILPDIPQMSAEVVEELQRLTEELYQLQNRFQQSLEQREQ